ncbi:MULTISPECIES: hypothetical protein [unclassified Nocardia]|uniref:hypothetical protein n=1 Tax=unclassified Nocardia TaxID=2637762 RepID=UPI00278BEB95|nr:MULTISPECIES: hypothetical protein [unclassified Nocardia]
MNEPDTPNSELIAGLATYLTKQRAQELIAAESHPPEGRGAAWVAVLHEAARLMGDGWTVVGSGMRAKLLHTPVAWWIDAIGNDGNTTPWLTLTHRALTTPLHPDPYTIRQDRFAIRQEAEFPPIPRGRPDIFDTTTSAAMVRWFAEGPLTDDMTRNSDRDIAEIAERWYTEKFNARPRKWPMLAGWRAIFGTGSPIPVIDDMLGLIEQGIYTDEKPFWEAFRAVAGQGDRSTMLAFLDTERRRGLREHYNLADDLIADVLTEN